ncbi:MAG: SDR family oxidoreductase [Lentisphaeria bacterium]|jgi:NAD(P)-dependent dehydrogenase (short-subunit alcohol dehydrogenase family)|nr:SDR family oxidoreductase [Lentisphaeria bacterium]
MILAGQKVLITGASRGIGEACARRCASEGAKVVLVARNRERLDEVRDSLPGDGHIAISADLRNPDECVPAILKKACEDGLKLTGLVHAAGIAPVVPVKMIATAELLDIFTVNYFSFMLLVRHFIRKTASDGGSIVAISSVAACSGWQGLSAYAGTKGALNASIRSLAVELADKGFRVNSIMPSNIDTDMLKEMTSVLNEDEIEQLKKKQPLGFGAPEDVANAVAFLLSPASKFITGTLLPVDGGYTAI